MTAQHPFAPFVAALGRGPGRSRDLDGEEAQAAMEMILDGRVEPVQLGAFLMLMRYKQESSAELAGFVRAVRSRVDLPKALPRVDLDWPSYADRHKQLPWFVLSALLLAANGVKVLMHGIAGEAEGYAPTDQTLTSLGISACNDFSEAARRLEQENFAYVRLERFCPALGALFDLRPMLGLRSPVNSLARALNPTAAPAQIQGVFHPPYRALHQQAAKILGQPNSAIFKGGGGEAQRNPEKPLVVEGLADGASFTEEWAALTPGAGYPWRGQIDQVDLVAALWQDRYHAPAATAAVTGTAAVALKLLGRADSMEGAQALAEDLWAARPADLPLSQTA